MSSENGTGAGRTGNQWDSFNLPRNAQVRSSNLLSGSKMLADQFRRAPNLEQGISPQTFARTPRRPLSPPGAGVSGWADERHEPKEGKLGPSSVDMSTSLARISRTGSRGRHWRSQRGRGRRVRRECSIATNCGSGGSVHVRRRGGRRRNGGGHHAERGRLGVGNRGAGAGQCKRVRWSGPHERRMSEGGPLRGRG